MAGPSAGEVTKVLALSLATSHTRLTSPISLPIEILSHIISLTDKPTALAFVRVCRYASSVNIDAFLWRHLRLGVPEHTISVRHDAPPKAAGPTEEAKEVIGGDLRLQTILSRLREGTRRASLIRSIEMVSVLGALRGMIDLLEAASSTLEALTINASQSHPSDSLPDAEDTLDIRLLHSGTTFPSLRMLTVGKSAFRVSDAIPYLVGLAPLLHTLIVNISHMGENGHFPFPTPQPHPNVHHLTITRQMEGEEDPQAVEDFKVYFDLVPNIRRLSADYPLAIYDTGDTCWLGGEATMDDWESARAEVMMSLIHLMGDLTHLRELDWRTVDAVDFWQYVWGHNVERFAHLRRIVLGPVTWEYMFDLTPGLSNIEAIFFNRTVYDTYYTTNTYPRPMSPSFTKFLRDSPKLRLLHLLDRDDLRPGLAIFDQLDDIEASRTANGQVTSIRHHGEEVFHVHLLFELAGKIEVHTDYTSKVVPLEVLEQMRVVDGKSAEEWRGRGIDVGEEAWGVLRKWYAEQR